MKNTSIPLTVFRALDLDDFKNVCDCEEYPLLRTINRVLRKYPGPHNNCVLESRKKMKPVSEPTTKKPMITDASTKRPSIATTSRVTPRTTQSRQTTTRRTTTTETPPLDEFPEEPASDDEKTCSEGRLFMPHESDCNKYYQCDHGTVHVQR